MENPRDIVLRWGRKAWPHLFFVARLEMLFLIIAFSILWIIGGWDATIQHTIMQDAKWYGTGVHWSTAQAFAITIYVLMINFQKGGGFKLSNLWEYVKQDLKSLSMIHKHKIRRELPCYQHDSEPLRAGLVSLFVAVAGLFLFENIWVLFYNYFQFGSWWWPIYMVQTSGDPFYSFVLWRNMIFFVAPFLCALIAFKFAGKGGVMRYRVKFMFNLKALLFLILFVGGFGVWIYYPFPHNTLEFEDLAYDDVMQFEAGRHLNLKRELYIYPNQADYFPQTSYTFYPIDTYMQGYKAIRILGFHVNDDLVHGFNVALKYLGFLVLAYPLMLKVKRINEV